VRIPHVHRLLSFVSTLPPLLIWWMVFLPGTFSIDSIEVVNQIRSNSWNDWHTNAYTSFVWVTSFRGQYWSLVTLSQILLMALAIGSIGSSLMLNGIPPKVIYATNFLFCAMPQVGAFAITAWKDVPSTAGALMLTAALMEYFGYSPARRSSLLLALVGSLLLASFRWNGPAAIGLLCVSLLLLARKQSRKIVASIGLAGLLALGSLIVPQQLNLTESASWFNFRVRELHDISFLVKHRLEIFSDEDKRLLAEIMPLSDWALGGSSCEGVENLQYKAFNRNAPASYETAQTRQEELTRLWRKGLKDAPLSIATIRMCRAGGSLSPIFFGQQPTLGLWVANSSDPELVRSNYFPTLNRLLTGFTELSSKSEFSKTITLNAMLWSIIAIAVTRRIFRKHPHFVVVFLVGFCIIASVAIGANAHDARYVAGALLTAQYLTGVVLIAKLMGINMNSPSSLPS
jgi:hypothetical protein